jgi:hypothetical protein
MRQSGISRSSLCVRSRLPYARSGPAGRQYLSDLLVIGRLRRVTEMSRIRGTRRTQEDTRGTTPDEIEYSRTPEEPVGHCRTRRHAGSGP